MLTVLVLFVMSSATLCMLLLLIVVIGIHHEPRMNGMSEQAPNLIAAFVRRLLGVYVCKPGSSSEPGPSEKGHASLLAGSTYKPNPE